MNRRNVLRAAAALGGLAVVGTTARASQWPERPVRLIVPYPPGGLTDIVSRVRAESVGKVLGQPIVVDNRAGAGGQIGLQALMQAPRDGHTIALVVPATMITLPLTNPNYPFQPLKDFEPITIAVDTYLTLVVSPELGVRTLAEFVDYAKKHAGELNYGTPGAGTSFHFNNVVLAQKLGIEATHVPYAGEVKMLGDVAGGQLQYALASNATRPFIESGKVVALAVTAKQRVAALPQVPTFTEAGVEFASDGWVGYAAAAGTPAAVLDRLNAAFVEALRSPQVAKTFAEMGYTVVGSSRAQFRSLVEQSTPRYAQLISSGAVRLESN